MVRIKICIKAINLLVHVLYIPNTFLEHCRITIELNAPQSCHDVGHVALVPRTEYIVLTGDKISLCQRILVQAIKREQLRETVNELIPSLPLNERNRISTIDLLTLYFLIAKRQIPSHRNPRCGWKVRKRGGEVW